MKLEYFVGYFRYKIWKYIFVQFKIKHITLGHIGLYLNLTGSCRIVRTRQPVEPYLKQGMRIKG